MTRLIEGDLVASTAGITIVVARFNELIVDSLLNGALTTLKRQGVRRSSDKVSRQTYNGCESARRF